MSAEKSRTARQQISSWMKDLGLYAVLAVFLVVAPMVSQHWLLVMGLSWLLALVLVGRIIQMVSGRTATGSPVLSGTAQPAYDKLALAVVGISYLAIVIVMWAPFSFSSGMGYETGFSWRSENSTWLNGFVDLGDPMRPFTNFFYQISYLLGLLVGHPGSFVPFQFVYAALWWGRGILVFLVLRQWIRGYDLLCYLTGVLALVHSSDRSLQWVGQLNQFGYIFWMLLAIYLLLRAVDDETTPLGVYVRTMTACTAELFCLWSYESGLIILILTPPIVWIARRKMPRRFLVTSAAWYGLVGVYLYLTVQKYLHAGQSTYQASVMRADWRLASLCNDLVFNVQQSLLFWTADQVPGLDISRATIGVLAGIAVLVVLASGFWLVQREKRRDPGGLVPPVRVLVAMFGCGLVVLVASFPVFLLLSSARGLWRTQFLSGIGTAVVLASILAMLFRVAGGRGLRLGSAVCLIAVGGVTYAGARHAIELGCVHREIWQRERRVVAGILHTAPQVKPGTLVLVTGIPRRGDPFGDSMWLDLALRLSYPWTRVAGAYFYREDGATAPGNVFRLHGDHWVRDRIGFPPLLVEAPAGDVLILEYEGDHTRVLPTVPPYMCAANCDAHDYQPQARILPGKPSPRAVNRYGPL